jgi:hypothetical protein
MGHKRRIAQWEIDDQNIGNLPSAAPFLPQPLAECRQVQVNY